WSKGAHNRLRRQRRRIHRQEDPSRRSVRLLGAVVRPGREHLQGGLRHWSPEDSDPAETALRPDRGAEPDPPLAAGRWRDLLQRAAFPRLEAHFRGLANDAPGRLAGHLEVVRSPLPTVAGAVPLVRLGRFWPPQT